MSEIARFLRHAITPVVAYAVAAGWLPEAAQGDAVEAAVIVATFVVTYGVSWYRDRVRQ